MARIRTIKPDFFTSEDIVSLSPLARLLFIATWLEADREGRFVWRPKTMKLRYLPGDDCNIERLANELISAGLVATYDAGGQTYAEIPTFKRHQVINNRESESTIPPRETDTTPTRDARVNHATATPLAGREGNGKEVHVTRDVQDESDDGFADFWSAYPKKAAKPQALKAWRKLKPTGQLLTDLMAGLGIQKASEQWRRDAGQFIPHPASWLNGRRWEDQTPAPTLANTDAGQASIFRGAV